MVTSPSRRSTGALFLSMSTLLACATDFTSPPLAHAEASDVTVDGVDAPNPERAPETWVAPTSHVHPSAFPAGPFSSPLPLLAPPFVPPALGPLVPFGEPPIARLPASDPGFGLGVTPVPFRGMNLSSAEFGTALPGVDGKDYTFSTPAEVDYYLTKGFNTFRIGFKWERMQRSARAELDPTYFARLDELVTYATSRGATVILNPHNFARYYGKVVGSPDVPTGVFGDFWGRMAAAYADNPRVMFNLVNEPHDLPTEQWVDEANDAIDAIRDVGADNVIIVPGNSWTGAHAWTSDHYGTPNSVALLKIVDPANKVLFEVHQYLDKDSSGSSGVCVSTSIGRERLRGFVQWLRDNGRKGFLGEFAGGDNPTCNKAVTELLDYMHESADVIAGWAWWAGGPWWGDYKFSLHPDENGDRPQMALLTPYLGYKPIRTR